MTVFKEFAPAKINLTLRVLGKRPDGYHELESLVAFADVGDFITLDVAKPVGVTMSGRFAGSIAGANLLDVTLRRLSEANADLQLGAVHIEKNLPVAAGIGGGSADAAAVIRAVKRANPEHVSKVDWLSVARAIGADVPVCLASQLSWMTGLGDNVEILELERLTVISAVIVNPLVLVPADKTAQVFGALSAETLAPDFRSVPRAPETYSKRRVIEIVLDGNNALQEAACSIVPEVAAVLDELVKLPNCRLARMSGGGPTCFALFDDHDDALTADEILSGKQPDWWSQSVALL